MVLFTSWEKFQNYIDHERLGLIFFSKLIKRNYHSQRHWEIQIQKNFKDVYAFFFSFYASKPDKMQLCRGREIRNHIEYNVFLNYIYGNLKDL